MSTKDKLRDHDVAIFLKTQIDVIRTLTKKGIQFLKDKQPVAEAPKPAAVENVIADESQPDLQDEWKTLPESLLKVGYVFSSLLHTGQSSLVIRATKQKTSERVAIKCVYLKEGSTIDYAQKELENQYESLKVCKGATNIVQVFEYIKAETCPYIFLVMQECKGTLQELLDQEQGKSQLSEQSIIKYMRDITIGLQEAQEFKQEIFELLPSEILIDYAGNALISRFGRRIARTKGEMELRDMVGESAYVAPECIQFLSDSQKDASLRDQTKKQSYSLGILLYRLMLNYASSKEKLMHVSMFRNQPISVEQETEQFHYKSLWRQLITDLTHFLPAKRYTIEIALCIINGIYQQELKDSISQRCLTHPTEEVLKTFKKDIDLISMGSNSEFYPLLKITPLEFEERYSKISNPFYKIEETVVFKDLVNKHLVNLLEKIADREKTVKEQAEIISLFKADNKELQKKTIAREMKELKTQEELEEYGLKKANLFLKYLGLDFQWTSFQEQIANGDLKDEGDSYAIETITLEPHKKQKIYKLRGPGHNYFEFMHEEELVRRNKAQYALAHKFFDFLTNIKEEIIERKYLEQLAIVAEKKKAEEAERQRLLEEQKKLEEIKQRKLLEEKTKHEEDKQRKRALKKQKEEEEKKIIQAIQEQEQQEQQRLEEGQEDQENLNQKEQKDQENQLPEGKEEQENQPQQEDQNQDGTTW